MLHSGIQNFGSVVEAQIILCRFPVDELHKLSNFRSLASFRYTGERQLVYLLIRSHTDVTMCLKQNRKIKRWEEQILAVAQWCPYGEEYRIASGDFALPETKKRFRFVVEQHLETHGTRCFGSMHTQLSATEILNRTMFAGR